MRIPILTTVLLAVVGLALVIGAAWAWTNRDPRLLRDVAFQYDRITPNADGDRDATRITYSLNRSAVVSIYLIAADGQTYYFRKDQLRSRTQDEPYTVIFSGVVQGYRRPGDTFQGTILARLVPDGDYRWVVAAVDPATGQREEATGSLTIADADPQLIELRKFTASPPEITPNRDGISDRTAINYYLNKQAESVQVYLIGPQSAPPEQRQRYDVSEKETVNKPGEPGEHTYDYAGGVDEGVDPPPDGDYIVYADGADAEGQRVEVTTTLRIAEGGVPRADLVAPAVGDQVEFSTQYVAVGAMLYFTTTVENFGDADIRTTGPWPGTCYNLDQNYNTLGFVDEPGAWRVGLDFETSPRNYPFRWAVGRPEDLVQRVIDGNVFYYLPKGHRAQITGCVRITFEPERNPLYFWGGLIHQDVEVAEFNNHVDPHLIQVEAP